MTVPYQHLQFWYLAGSSRQQPKRGLRPSVQKSYESDQEGTHIKKGTGGRYRGALVPSDLLDNVVSKCFYTGREGFGAAFQ